MLSLLVTARYPKKVAKLILVSSGPLEASYAPQTGQTRAERLGLTEKELKEALKATDDPRLLLSRSDNYDPLPNAIEPIPFKRELYHKVWREALEMRERGDFVEAARAVQCPILAIHGEYDPHPYRGVEGPLSRVSFNYTFILLKACGHTPWIERQARAHFLELVRKAIISFPKLSG